MKTSKSRHSIVEGLVCEQCGKTYSARKQRVDAGLGRFCSITCSNKFHAKGSNKKYVGKENGKVSYDKTRNAYYVYWFEPETLKRKTTSYARWYWEMNHGEIPDGYVASHKDGDTSNIEPDNIVLTSPEEFASAISKRMKGVVFSDKTRKKMSESAKTKVFSDEHRYKISLANRGDKNYFWVDGRSYAPYPPEFDNQLKHAVRRRDRNKCMACGMNAKGILGNIHHIDSNKQNSDIHNLILLCDACHKIVHMKSRTDNPIVLWLQSKLDVLPK